MRPPFFSSDGRVSRGSFVAWVALGLGALMLCVFILTRDFYPSGSYPVPIGMFGLMGMEVAKLRAESIRRLRDEGTAPGTGWWVAVAVTLGSSFLFLSYS